MKILVNLALLIFTSLALLAIIELGLYLNLSRSAQVSFNDRPPYYFPIEKRWEECLSENLRVKDPSVFRIVVVGDSFTFPTKIRSQDTYSVRLENALNQYSKKKVEVIACGLPGLNINKTPWIVENALEKGADYFLYQITLNDGEKHNLTLDALEDMHKGKYTFRRLEVDETTYPLLHHSQLFKMLINRLHSKKRSRSYVQYHKDLFLPQAAWSSYFRDLERIRDVANRKKVKMGAVVFPMFSHQVDAAYPFMEVHEKIDKGLAALGIPFIDLRVHYENKDSYRLAVEPIKDPHPNEIGHRIAADAIYDWLHNSDILSKQNFPKEVYMDYYREGRKIEFNDAAHGIFPTPDDVIQQGKRRKLESKNSVF